MPNVASGVPSALYRATANVEVWFPPPYTPAATTLPSGWIATPNARPLRVPPNAVVATPPVPKVLSREPSVLSRATANVVTLPLSRLPETTIFPLESWAMSHSSL